MSGGSWLERGPRPALFPAAKPRGAQPSGSWGIRAGGQELSEQLLWPWPCNWFPRRQGKCCGENRMCFPAKSLVSQDHLHTGGDVNVIPCPFPPQRKVFPSELSLQGRRQLCGLSPSPSPRGQLPDRRDGGGGCAPGSKEAPLFDFLPHPGPGWKERMAPALAESASMVSEALNIPPCSLLLELNY